MVVRSIDRLVSSSSCVKEVSSRCVPCLESESIGGWAGVWMDGWMGGNADAEGMLFNLLVQFRDLLRFD